MLAYSERLSVVVEAKDQARSVTVSDVDALRSRLNRVPAGFVGALFTTADLSSSAVAEIRANRSQRIVVFVGDEVEELRSGRKNVSALLHLKLRALTHDAEVLVGRKFTSEYLDVTLPSSSVTFQVGQRRLDFFESRVSSFGGPSFALEIPDPAWGRRGDGARISIPMDAQDHESFRDALGYLHKNFGLSRNGSYSIGQSECAWHGVGAGSFVRALGNWRGRYESSEASAFHHSEELVYFDSFDGGWVEVYVQQRVPLYERRDPFLFHAEITIQLPGIPLDNSRISELCHYVGCPGANFQWITDRVTSARRLTSLRKLDFIGTAVEDLGPPVQDESERIVVGVIAKNPFFGRRSLKRELAEMDISVQAELTQTELLLCSLRHQHDEGFSADYYALEGFEWTEAGRSYVIRPFCTYHELTRNSSVRR